MKRKSHRIPGQGKQEDSSLKDFFRDNDRFAGLFNHMLSKEDRIDPNDLIELDTDEMSLIDVGSHGRIILQQFRDVVKGVLGEMDGIVPFGMKLAGMNALLAVMGLENQSYIDYLAPLRIRRLETLNLERQVSIIKERHRQEIAEAKKNGASLGLTKDELWSGFYKDDKIAPVLCIIIYYGKKEWDGPRDLSDMYIRSGYAKYANPYPIKIIDVRRMKDAEQYPGLLKAFFGFIRHEGTDKLEGFINRNKALFSDVPDSMMKALIEVTGSQELRQIEQENTNPSTGGINMCAGIQMMIDKGRRKGEKRGERRGERKGERRGQIIGAIQAWAEIGLKKDEILTRIIMKYHLKELEASNYYDKAISSPSSSGVKVNCKIQ